MQYDVGYRKKNDTKSWVYNGMMIFSWYKQCGHRGNVNIKVFTGIRNSALCFRRGIGWPPAIIRLPIKKGKIVVVGKIFSSVKSRSNAISVIPRIISGGGETRRQIVARYNRKTDISADTG